MDQIRIDQTIEKEQIQHLFFPNKKNYNIYHGFLEKCQKKIIVCMYQISHKQLANTLIKLSRIGREIQIITNSNNDEEILLKMIQESLEKITIAVYEKQLCLMHSKYCVIDDQIIMTGSANWTNNAFRKNIESVVILNNEKEAQLYSCEFSKVWNQSQILRLKGQHLDSSPPFKMEYMNFKERNNEERKFTKRIIDLEDSHLWDEEEVKEQSDESVKSFYSQKLKKMGNNFKNKKIRKYNLQSHRCNQLKDDLNEGNDIIQIDSFEKQNIDQNDEIEIML